MSDTITLWRQHRRVAYQVAGEFRLPGAERQDVEQEALIALWVAARDSDPSQGVRFGTFAHHVIRRRLGSAPKAALRKKHEPLNNSVRVTRTDDGGDLEEVAILDTLPGGRDPLEVVLARESLERMGDAVGRLTPSEREALQVVVAGIPYRGDKRIDNAAQRAKRKLRAVA